MAVSEFSQATVTPCYVEKSWKEHDEQKKILSVPYREPHALST